MTIIMLCIPNIDDYLRIQSDNEVKDFVVKHFGEYFKSMKKHCILNFANNKILEKLLNCFICF